MKPLLFLRQGAIAIAALLITTAGFTPYEVAAALRQVYAGAETVTSGAAGDARTAAGERTWNQG